MGGHTFRIALASPECAICGSGGGSGVRGVSPARGRTGATSGND
eukprot:SAG11_NODE_19760_length_459_cov_1.113889_1_plen_43_part_10